MVTVRLAHAALTGMVARKRGNVVNVSSVAAFGQSPGNASYCATKAWMNSFTEGLYLELKGSGSPVKVQALCPGFTQTEFHDTMGFDRKRIPDSWWMSADDVVRASLEGLARGKLIVIPGRRYQFLSLLQKLLPRSLRHFLAIRYGRKTRRESARHG
jgi:short-subunit dehydrogenase